jgi:hypothetical protein
MAEMKKIAKPKPKPKSKRVIKKRVMRGAPGAGTKERKALDALFKTYNRPAFGSEDNDDS